jgi:hypothetical protein
MRAANPTAATNVGMRVLPFSKIPKSGAHEQSEAHHDHHATDRPPPRAPAHVVLDLNTCHWSDMRKTAIVADASRTNGRSGCRMGKIAPWKNGARKTNGDFAHAERRTRGYGGVKTVDGAQDSRFPSGRIALQYGQGTVKFRRVQIKPL